MVGAEVPEAALAAALGGGDVASVILSPLDREGGRLEESVFAARAEALVPLTQSMGAAAFVAFETRVAGRSGADGVHFEGQGVEEDVRRVARETSVGVGNVTDRHGALVVGEWPVDYVFFGRLHRDIRPEPHARNLKLAEWFADIVTLPCIVSGGNVVESVVDVAATGADFAALQSAIFEADDPGEAVARANGLLDGHAPRFETS